MVSDSYTANREYHARKLASIYLKDIWAKYKIMSKEEAQDELKKRMGMEDIKGCPIASMNEKQANKARFVAYKILWDSRDENDKRCYRHYKGYKNRRSIGWIGCASDVYNQAFMTSYRILEDGYLLTGWDTYVETMEDALADNRDRRVVVPQKRATFHCNFIPNDGLAVTGKTGIVSVELAETEADAWYKNGIVWERVYDL